MLVAVQEDLDHRVHLDVAVKADELGLHFGYPLGNLQNLRVSRGGLVVETKERAFFPLSSFAMLMSATPPTSSPFSSSKYPHVAVAPSDPIRPSLRIPRALSPLFATSPSKSLATGATRSTSPPSWLLEGAERSACAAPATLPATPPSVSDTLPGAVVCSGEFEFGTIEMSTARTPTTTRGAGATGRARKPDSVAAEDSAGVGADEEVGEGGKDGMKIEAGAAGLYVEVQEGSIAALQLRARRNKLTNLFQQSGIFERDFPANLHVVAD